MRFVQFADIHLDSNLGGALDLPPEKKEALRDDIRTALARACALVREIKADLVLVPGDLFDYETAGEETAAFLSDIFAATAPAKVFVAPGNHDSLRPGSPYLWQRPEEGEERDVSGKGFRQTTPRFRWPGNVHVFASSRFGPLPCPSLAAA